MHVKRTRLIATILALLAIACGSTNEPRIAETSTDDTSAVASDAPSGSGAPVATTDAQGNPVGSATVSAPGARGAPGGTGGSAPGAQGALARGTGEIKIGFHYSSNIQSAYAAFGAEGEFVDVEEAVTKMVGWVNARGGLGGKKVVPVFHGTDPLQGSFPEQAERACTFFAEDAKVAYVVSGAILPDDNMPACFAKRNLPLVWDYQYLMARNTFDRYPNTLYMPHNIGTYRLGFYIDALNAAKYFDAGAKIGLVRYDTAVHKEFADKIVKPGLAKIGKKLVAEAALSKPQSAGEAGTTANQAAAAILRFRNAGVSHLLWVPSGGAIPLVWGNAADGQGFRPRNAFTSLDIPNFVTDNLSPEQLDRAMVVGWMPANDTYMQYVPKTAQLEDCKSATGVKTDTDVVRYCDGLFFLKAALDKTPVYGVAGLRRAAEALGTGYRSPWTIRTRLAPGRHDGATSYRMLQYNAACECFRFVSAAKAIG